MMELWETVAVAVFTSAGMAGLAVAVAKKWLDSQIKFMYDTRIERLRNELRRVTDEGLAELKSKNDRELERVKDELRRATDRELGSLKSENDRDLERVKDQFRRATDRELGSLKAESDRELERMREGLRRDTERELATLKAKQDRVSFWTGELLQAWLESFTKLSGMIYRVRNAARTTRDGAASHEPGRLEEFTRLVKELEALTEECRLTLEQAGVFETVHGYKRELQTFLLTAKDLGEADAGLLDEQYDVIDHTYSEVIGRLAVVTSNSVISGSPSEG